jgi:hypothetical protein
MIDHPFTESAQGRMALRLLLVGGLRRWRGGGGDFTRMPLRKFEAVLRPIPVDAAAMIVMRLLHGMEFGAIAEHLGQRSRQSVDQRFRWALKVLRDTSGAEELRDLFETHREPRTHLYRRKWSPKFKGAADEQTDRYFDAARIPQFFDRLFGDAPPRTSDD